MPTRSARSDAVSFKDFSYYERGREVKVSGAEIMEQYELLAEVNKVPLAALLDNRAIRKGERLRCVSLRLNAQGKPWMPDSSGYLMLKLKSNPTFRGVSFVGQPLASPYVPPRRARMKKRRDSCAPQTPSRRSQRPKMGTNKRTDFCYDSASPGGQEGVDSPVLIRLHRAAGLAATPCPASPPTPSQRDFLHICGVKNCGVVAHFRPGTEADNCLDRSFHRRRPGHARIAHKAL